MDAKLEAGIHAVYPTGRLEEPDPAQCDFTHVKRLIPLLTERLPAVGARLEGEFEVWTGLERMVENAIGLVECSGWSEKGTGQEQVEYLRHNDHVTVLCITISSVVPAIDYTFNTHRLTTYAEQGEMTCDYSKEPPSPEWGRIREALFHACAEAGIIQLSAEEMEEPVPFVQEMIFEDNDALDRLEVCDVWQCLFQGY